MTRKRKTEARKQRKLKELNTLQKIDKKKMKQDQGGERPVLDVTNPVSRSAVVT